MAVTNHLEHGVGRDPKTGRGKCTGCDWTGPFHLADVHLAQVKAAWEAHNRLLNTARREQGDV